MELTLVRHTHLDIEPGICYGQSDVLPGESFEDEASGVMSQLEGKSFDKVYSSPLKRCTLLAQQCGFKKYVEDSRIAEINFGDWELLPWDNIVGDYAQKWFKDYVNLSTPNGESLLDMINRVGAFLSDLKRQKPESALCFTHSGPIRIFHYLINNLLIDDLFKFEVDYAGVYTYRY